MADASGNAGSTTVPSQSVADDQRQSALDALKSIRSRADLTAKSLGGVGTTVVTAIGIAKITDVFPLQRTGLEGAIAAIALVAGFVAMAVVVGYFSFKLWHVNEPIMFSANADKVIGPEGEEQEIVSRAFDQSAHLHGLSSLAAYERREQRLRRIAERSDDERAKELFGKADAIRGNIRATYAMVAADVARKRAHSAVVGRMAIAMYLVFVAGVLGFALGASYLDGQRTTQVALAKSCGDARTAGADKSELPKVCFKPAASAPSAPLTQVQKAQALQGLSAGLKACEDAAAKAKVRSDAACSPWRDAIAGLKLGG